MDQIQCKRIINGRTYNTETAAQLGHWELESYPVEETLFKTRHGAYFLYIFYPNDPNESVKPLDSDEAQTWIAAHCLPSVWKSEFGDAPEAGHPEARITLRVPETLRRRIAVIADSQQQSLNAWILRCLERCAIDSSGQVGLK